jgi:hypothetical protein
MKAPKSISRHGQTWANRVPKSRSRSPLKGGLGHLSKSAPSPIPLLGHTGEAPPALPALSATFVVGRYTCTMTFPLPAGSAATIATWLPETPGKLAPEELAQYRAGRDALMAEVARQTGLNIAIVEP